MKELITIPQYAKLIGVKHQYIYQLIKAERLNYTLIAGIKLIASNEQIKPSKRALARVSRDK